MKLNAGHVGREQDEKLNTFGAVDLVTYINKFENTKYHKHAMSI